MAINNVYMPLATGSSSSSVLEPFVLTEPNKSVNNQTIHNLLSFSTVNYLKALVELLD